MDFCPGQARIAAMQYAIARVCNGILRKKHTYDSLLMGYAAAPILK